MTQASRHLPPATRERQRPLPHPTPLSAPHWEGAKQGRLMVQRCDDCHHHVFPPQPACGACFSPNLTWVPSSGRGTIYSYTIIHRPPDETFETPYCAAIIEVNEDWYMISNVIGTPMEEIAVGLPVEVAFVPVEDMVLPMFRVVTT
jgi:uncharacterized OB-fold protein